MTPQKSAISYFYNFIFFSLLMFVGAYLYGGSWGVLQAFILSVLEVSLSFDNAVVNAIILAHMAVFWRKMFVTWGILVAVFGMRLLFPIFIVVGTTDMGFYDAFLLALNNPAQYEEILQSSHHILMSFGGSFLLMVFLTFLFDKKKEIHWIEAIESRATRWASLGELKVVVIFLMLSIIGYFAPNQVFAGNRILYIDKSEVVLGMVYGITLYVIIELIRGFLEDDKADDKTELEKIDGIATQKAMRGGFVSFMYLELIDASFSFDGVLGAFALSQNIIIIMIGLGVGAFAIRSLTLLMVDRKTVQNYRYLEHGAMWSIGILAVTMIVQIFEHLNNTFVTVITVLPITLAFMHSLAYNKKKHTLEIKN